MTAPARVLVYGFATTGQAVARSLRLRGSVAIIADDHPSDPARDAAQSMGMELLEHPSRAQLVHALRDVDALVPSPGVPDHHAVFDVARGASVPVLSQLDLAREWDHRPIVAITATDGKTTVTSLVTSMLQGSGRRAVAAGNDAVPLVEAIDDPLVETFVVETSSFTLGHTHHFEPHVATWLNFAPDHLDVHRSVESYEAAKASIWANLPSDAVAVANADDPVVMRNRDQHRRAVTFSTEVDADYHVADGRLVDPHGETIITVDELWRSMPHDVSNALGAAATAIAAGASHDGVHNALREFTGLPHRLEHIGEWNDIRWYDDSKATVPHATLAALRAFDSVVLVAGGRNKGLDLGVLAEGREHLRAVVTIGEAGPDIAAVFDGAVPVEAVPAGRGAPGMADAVALAAGRAKAGDVVLLSPGCTSFDWFGSYGQRGDAFRAAVERHHGAIGIGAVGQGAR
jgi:UDP-N-acetylmuramoylalanine--D-glutamate ligase